MGSRVPPVLLVIEKFATARLENFALGLGRVFAPVLALVGSNHHRLRVDSVTYNELVLQCLYIWCGFCLFLCSSSMLVVLTRVQFRVRLDRRQDDCFDDGVLPAPGRGNQASPPLQQGRPEDGHTHQPSDQTQSGTAPYANTTPPTLLGPRKCRPFCRGGAVGAGWGVARGCAARGCLRGCCGGGVPEGHEELKQSG